MEGPTPPNSPWPEPVAVRLARLCSSLLARKLILPTSVLREPGLRAGPSTRIICRQFKSKRVCETLFGRTFVRIGVRSNGPGPLQFNAFFSRAFFIGAAAVPVRRKERGEKRSSVQRRIELVRSLTNVSGS